MKKVKRRVVLPWLDLGLSDLLIYFVEDLPSSLLLIQVMLFSLLIEEHAHNDASDSDDNEQFLACPICVKRSC